MTCIDIEQLIKYIHQLFFRTKKYVKLKVFPDGVAGLGFVVSIAVFDDQPNEFFKKKKIGNNSFEFNICFIASNLSEDEIKDPRFKDWMNPFKLFNELDYVNINGERIEIIKIYPMDLKAVRGLLIKTSDWCYYNKAYKLVIFLHLIQLGVLDGDCYSDLFMLSIIYYSITASNSKIVKTPIPLERTNLIGEKTEQKLQTIFIQDLLNQTKMIYCANAPLLKVQL